MYRSVFDAKWRLESSLVLFLIKPVFLLILISDHENNKFICSSNMFFSHRLLIVGAETFWIIQKTKKKDQKTQGWTRVSWYIFLYFLVVNFKDN